MWYLQVIKNGKEAFVDILPALVLLYAVKTWGTWKFHDIAYHHRD